MPWGISRIFTLSLFILYIVPKIKNDALIVTASITFIFDYVFAYLIKKFIPEDIIADINIKKSPFTLVISNLVYSYYETSEIFVAVISKSESYTDLILTFDPE